MPARRDSDAGGLVGVPVGVGQCRPAVGAERPGFDGEEVPVGLGVAVHPERQLTSSAGTANVRLSRL